MSHRKGLLFKYFVLSPTKNDAHGVASREAVERYAESIEVTDPLLAQELTAWLDEIEEEVSSTVGE